MSIMEKLFGAKPQTAPATTLPGSAAPVVQPQANTATAPNGVVPQGSETSTVTTTEAKAPLADFAKLWETPVGADGKPIVPATPEPMFNVDNAALLAAAKQVDFSKAITPDMMAAITKGGPEAGNAFVQAMNAVAQLTYAQSARATTQLTEQAINRAREQFVQAMPEMVRNQSVNESLRQADPLFSNPAVQPLLDMVKSQLQLKHPNASVQEITTLSQSYLQQVVTAATPAPATPKPAPGEIDWSTFLTP